MPFQKYLLYATRIVISYDIAKLHNNLESKYYLNFTDE